MTKEVLFGLIGGLGLFLFGMRLLSEGLQKVAGSRLRNILKLLTNVPVVGVLTGAGVTSLIQSSSATTVMVVGFVHAGLMVLRQAIPVIMGANIGTTVTAQVIAFKIDQYALPAVGIGFALMVLGRRRYLRFWGQALLGFGLLFYGLHIMKGITGPLTANAGVVSLFTRFSEQPILGVVAGAIVTFIVQSSSATVGLTMVLAAGGAIDFSGAVALVLGENIGTCVTAMLASIGTNTAAKRAAISHVVFNVVGVCYMLPLVYTGAYPRFIEAMTPGALSEQTVMRHIANAHTMFNVFNALVFLPLVGLLAKLVVKIVPGEAGVVEAGPKYLEKHLLNTPAVALDQARREIVRMAGLAQEAVGDAMSGFFNSDQKRLACVGQKEAVIDGLQKDITEYLVELSERTLNREESEELPILIHTVNDIERIGDHAENLVELAERKLEERLPFSEEAMRDIKRMYGEVDNMASEVANALEQKNIDEAKQSLKREERLNRFQTELRQGHIQRLSEGKCHILSGIIFLDLVNNLEKIGDHLTNIAQAVMGSLRWEERQKEKILTG